MSKRTEATPDRPRLSVVAEGAASDLPDFIRSFERHLRLKNLAALTKSTLYPSPSGTLTPSERSVPFAASTWQSHSYSR